MFPLALGGKIFYNGRLNYGAEDARAGQEVPMKQHRFLRFCLVLTLILTLLPVSALADSSTTTQKTVYKDLSPNTEIYAVTDTAGSDCP